MNKNMKTIEESIETDVIGIIDRSGSMQYMGAEPIQALNAFLEEQKRNNPDDNALVTLVSFSNDVTTIVDHVPIREVQELEEKDYIPSGCTALNDAVCSTIKKELASDKPRNKVVVVITDGDENASQKYSTVDTRDAITDAETNYDWKFVFLGANIDAFASGQTINISQERCAQFDSSIPGDLLQLARQTSTNVNNYRRARSEGNCDHELLLEPVVSGTVSCPVGAQNISNTCLRSSPQSPIPGMAIPGVTNPPLPPTLKRSYAQVAPFQPLTRSCNMDSINTPPPPMRI